jgi:RNA polymerase sigma-70 factor (ECF subfamily)
MDKGGETLLGRLRDGDSRSFAWVVEYHTDMVYSVAYGIMGDAQDAEDACQEVFLRLFRAAPTLPAQTRLRSYLYRVCVNYCLDQLRRKSRQVTTDSLKEVRGLRADLPTPLQVAADHQLRDRVVAALQELSAPQRLAFVLRHFQGLKVAEVANVMGCAPGTAHSHLARAVKRLRDLLGHSFSE